MKLFENMYFKRAVFVFQVIAIVTLMIMAYNIEIVPMKYMITAIIVFIGLLALEYYILFRKTEKKVMGAIAQVISVLLSIVLCVCACGVNKLGKTVDLMTETSFQERAISVVVLDESDIRNERQIPDKKIGYMSSIDIESMTYAIEEIEKNIGSIDEVEYKDIKSLVDALYNKKIDAIILDEAFRQILEAEKTTFTKDTRVVYQITKTEAAIDAKNVDVTQKPFLVFVSGNDEYGKISAVSRTDVNMLVGVNPNTKQVLLVSIPRDTYVPLHTNQQYDKFTHSGIYGLQESMSTLEDLLDEEINYYGKMNFSSFLNIVDALGGIEVYSPVAFTTIKGHYEIKEGINKLNAKQALSFVRERKSFADGDFARGRNQQRMISALVKKVCSPDILTSFSDVLDVVSTSIETNMSSAELNALIQMQLSDMPSWDIQSCQIKGAPDSLPCYSSGPKSYSVIVPWDSSINEIKGYIDQFMNDEVVQTKDGDLNQE